jgi:hypothetical protein
MALVSIDGVVIAGEAAERAGPNDRGEHGGQDAHPKAMGMNEARKTAGASPISSG